MALGNFKGMFAASAALLSGIFGGSTFSACGAGGCVVAVAVGTSWTTDFRHFFRWFGLGAFDFDCNKFQKREKELELHDQLYASEVQYT